MSKNFPFTQYDFYAYLASGLVFLAATDFVFFEGVLYSQQSWSFVSTATLIALAYIIGQLLAIPSSLLLEHLIAGKFLRSPITIQLSSHYPMRGYEKVLAVLVGRYYSPLHIDMQNRAIQRAGMSVEEFQTGNRNKNIEQIFQQAFIIARKSEDTRARMDDFRNQYGFARNISFVTLLIIGLMAIKGVLTLLWFSVLLGVSLLMFLRFLKFYAAFHAEIVRSIAYSE